MSLDKPSIKVAGKFIHAHYHDIQYCTGGIIIGFIPWLFQAASIYGISTVDGREIKNILVFLGLEDADILGLTGGLGHNMDLKWPSVSEILSFPFISGDSADTDPMKQLDPLTTPGEWITPEEDVM